MDIGIKRKSPHEPSVHAGSSMVGVTGLEPMASWSRMLTSSFCILLYMLKSGLNSGFFRVSPLYPFASYNDQN